MAAEQSLVVRLPGRATSFRATTVIGVFLARREWHSSSKAITSARTSRARWRSATEMRASGSLNLAASRLAGRRPWRGNVISGNVGAGIVAGQPVGQGASSAVVIGNFIGTQADGISPLGNRFTASMPSSPESADRLPAKATSSPITAASESSRARSWETPSLPINCKMVAKRTRGRCWRTRTAPIAPGRPGWPPSPSPALPAAHGLTPGGSSGAGGTPPPPAWGTGRGRWPRPGQGCRHEARSDRRGWRRDGWCSSGRRA